MAAIWSTDPTGGWKLLSTAGFPDEDTLHTLVEQAPQLLPLAGSPRLAIVGREVRLGSGSADLIAVEPSGRVVVIEVKLAANAEARRAVVAQVLAYAAHLHGLTPAQLEVEVLGRHLHSRGHDSLFAAVTDASEEPTSEAAHRRFDEGLADSLAEGRFRLVIVLDAAPRDLVHLVGYLEYVTDRLVIDLVTVAQYQVGGTKLVVPSRIEPERFRAEHALGPEPAGDPGSESPGIDEFRKAVAAASVDNRALLVPLCDWAANLSESGLATLLTYIGRHGAILRVYVPGDMSLVTLNCGANTASIQMFQGVFDRRAPVAKVEIETLIGFPIKQGTAVRELHDGLLDAITAAYKEAATGKLTT